LLGATVTKLYFPSAAGHLRTTVATSFQPVRLTGAHGATTWQVDEQVYRGVKRKKVEVGKKK
jgi:hypothetical protein